MSASSLAASLAGLACSSLVWSGVSALPAMASSLEDIRQLENLINRVGTEPPWNIGRFYGSSYFVNPRGQMLAVGSEDNDELVVADLDLAMIDEVTVPRPSAGAGDFKLRPDRLKGVLQLAAEKAGWGTPLPAGRGRGIACTFDHLSYSAIVVEVTARGEGIHIDRIVCAADCGPVINPNGAIQQVQGGLLQALSVALHERITVKGGAVEQGNFNDYHLLRLPEVPRQVDVYFAQTDAPPSGLGETGVPPLAPALANAIAVATGKRLRSLPLDVKLA